MNRGGPIWRLRSWLIRRLAGDAVVILNIVDDGRTIAPAKLPCNEIIMSNIRTQVGANNHPWFDAEADLLSPKGDG